MNVYKCGNTRTDDGSNAMDAMAASVAFYKRGAPTVSLPRRIRLTCIPVQLAQRKLNWFGLAGRRPGIELI